MDEQTAPTPFVKLPQERVWKLTRIGENDEQREITVTGHALAFPHPHVLGVMSYRLGDDGRTYLVNTRSFNGWDEIVEVTQLVVAEGETVQ
jgi:hypothetical protein